MEPSSASRSWAKSPSGTSTDSSSRSAPPSPERTDLAEEVSGIHVPTSVVDSVIESTTDPANRLYRYPAARALLPILGRISWLTPNHVTYIHTLFGLAGAALVAFTEGRGWLILAFAFLEVRMVLDCFDGVLARARGTSSPFGRALDEIGDTVSVITLLAAVTHRLHLGPVGVFYACATLAFGGLCANAWDFYKRKLTFALRDSKDGALDELRQKKALAESGNGSFLGYWGIYFDCFQVLLYEVRPADGNPVAVIRARANDPQLRRFASLLSFLSFDNGAFILNLGVLTGLFLESELFVLVYAISMWLSTMVLARMILTSYPSPANAERIA